MGKHLSIKALFLIAILLMYELIVPIGNAYASANNSILPPSNLAFQKITPDDVKLTWSAVYGATGYNIYQIKEGQLILLNNTTAPNYSLNNLQEGTYTYVVSTLSAEGESGPCAPVSFEIAYPNMTAPSDLIYTIKNGNDVVLNWTASQYAESYKLYKISAEGEKTFLTSTTAPTYTILNASEGDITYAVSAVNSLYGESSLSTSVEVNVVYPTMSQPENLTFTITNGNDVKLTWQAASYAANYKIYQIIDGQRVLKSTVTSTNAQLTNLQEGEYVYKVYSYSDRFGESAEGSQVSFTVNPVTMAAPNNLTFKFQNINDVVLTWGTVPYAAGYKVYQIIDGEKVLKSTVTGSTITYTNMPAGDYVYKVYSYSDRFGESTEGSQVSLHVDLVTMDKPNDLSYKIQNGNDIVLTWAAVPNATNYKIYQVINGQKTLKSTVTSTSVTYTNMAAGDYDYEVYSYSSRFGESTEGSSLSFSLVFPTMEPPANVIKTIKSVTDFSLSWQASPFANSYKVYQIVDGQRILKNTVSGTTITYSNMIPGEYTYEIYSYSSRFGESKEGSLVEVTLNGQMLEAPSNLTYTITNGNDIALKWTAVQYATEYKVYQVVDGEKVLKSTVKGTTATFSNMPSGDYDYEVFSSSTLFGQSPTGAEVQVPLVVPVMVQPNNFTYKIQNGNDVVLNWEAVQYATSYKVYELIGDEEILKSTITSLTATFTNVSAGDHTYMIRSVSSRFGESQEASQQSFSLVFPNMQTPENLTYSITNGNDITLKWNSVSYATAYKIYQIIDGEKVLKKSVSGTSVVFTNMPEGEYTYQVYSSSDRFGESLEGSEMKISLVFPTMQAPGNAVYSITNGNDITLKWNSVSYATAYKIYQIIDGEKVLKKSVSGTSVVFTNMPEGDYTYQVYSYSDRFGESLEGSEMKISLVFPTMQAPGNAVYSITNGNDITLKWNNAAYATAYKIYQIIDGEKVLKKSVSGTSVVFSNMPEGDYTYEVHSYSDRFGESPKASTLNFNLTWPVVQPPVLEGSIFNANNLTLSWKAVTWANEYRIYKVNGDNKELIYKGTALSYKIYNLTEDIHSFEVTAYSTRFGESAGSNLLSKTIVYPVMQSPEVSLKLLSPTSAQITWNFTTYANGYNVYEIIDGKAVLLTKNLNNLSYTIQNLSYANHEYYVTSYSNSFGESVPSNTVIAKLIIDTAPPVTNTDIQTQWNQENQTITLKATDNDTGVAETLYSLNDSPFVKGTSITAEEEGMNKLSFYSIDKVGNIEQIKTEYIMIDKTAPITTSNVPTTWSNKDVVVNLTAADTHSGVAKTYYAINGSEYLEGTSFTVDKEGINEIFYYSVDQAGNKEEVQTIQVKIDKTAPVISMDLNEYYKLGSMLQLSYSAEDNLSGVMTEKMLILEPNETVEKEVEKGKEVELNQPGVYTVTVIVTDAAGNNTEVRKQFTIYIPVIIEVTSKVIKGNKGIFTVRAELPEGYSGEFDLNSATLNGVKALTSNNGYYQQAKLGQFKFERSDFIWTAPEVTVEFRCNVNGYLVIGHTDVKVQK